MEIALILLGLVILGLCSGLFGALFGLGGGVIFVPILMLVLELPPTTAVIISLIGIIARSVGTSTMLVIRGLSTSGWAFCWRSPHV